jgi:hypothetical protein
MQIGRRILSARQLVFSAVGEDACPGHSILRKSRRANPCLHLVPNPLARPSGIGRDAVAADLSIACPRLVGGFVPSDAGVNSQVISGWRAGFRRLEESSRRCPTRNRFRRNRCCLLPGRSARPYRFLDDPIVVELGHQHLVLRAVGASPALATETAGKLLYQRPFPSVDVSKSLKPRVVKRSCFAR